VVVSLRVNRGGKQTPVHDAFVATEKAEVRWDHAKCRFPSHVVVLRTTQTLVVGNQMDGSKTRVVLNSL
jgi:hypothetical protein